MPITLLDLILLVVMLISGLLAMIRGFIREVLSITAWALAAAAAVYAYAKLLPMVKPSFSSDILAAVVVVGGAFLLTLLIVSVITVRISDMILDSRIGALDRTLGFIFGLARGLIIVVVAFVFFDWLVKPTAQPKWVTDAKSLVVLKGTGQWLMSMSPDLEEWYARYKRDRRDDQPEQPAAQEQRSEERPADPEGYGRSERAGMDRLIQGNAKAR
jgi:membrane protein required for colicin V production